LFAAATDGDSSGWESEESTLLIGIFDCGFVSSLFRRMTASRPGQRTGSMASSSDGIAGHFWDIVSTGSDGQKGAPWTRLFTFV
jgi:hypothetical protein